MHLPQHEPAVAGQPQLQGQQSLPQQQVDLAVVAALVMVMMISVRMWMDAGHSHDSGRHTWRRVSSRTQQMARPKIPLW